MPIEIEVVRLRPERVIFRQERLMDVVLTATIQGWLGLGIVTWVTDRASRWWIDTVVAGR